MRGTKFILDEEKILRDGEFARSDWFTVNVKEWTWENDKEGDSDIIELLKQHNKGIWV